MKTKIFCIGYPKTGTTSLMYALKILDFDVCDGFGYKGQPEDISLIDMYMDEVLQKYEVFEDLPWPFFYKDLDKKFPDSKFILSIRNPDSWLKSVLNHFSEPFHLHEWAYGFPRPADNPEHYKKQYLAHNNEVLDYFKGRESDLLILDFSRKRSNTEMWSDLCHFLGKQTPNIDFPMANSKLDRKVINHLRKFKRKVFGPKPLNFYFFKIGTDFSDKHANSTSS